MTVVGIDAAVAERAGNRVAVENGHKVLYDGKTGAELARVALGATTSKTGGVPTPMGVVTGNCGSSYMYLATAPRQNNNLYYQFSTGFDLSTGSAYDFDWYTAFDSSWAYGTYHFEWSDHGPLIPAKQHWTSGWKTEPTSGAPTGTVFVGRVSSGTAYLTNGAICTSGYPTGSVAIY